VAGFDLLIWPTVFSPRLFRSGAVLAEVVERELTRQQTGLKMLDLGTGSGIIGLVAARAGAFVTAVDINSAAVRCANHNAVRSGLEGRMTCLQGDLWDAINGMTFDLIVFNPPFFRGEPRGPFEYAWCSTDVFERFSAGLDAHLAPLGSCLLLLSSDGDCESLLTRLTRNNWRIELVHECKGWTESQSIFRLSRSS